MLPGRKVLVAVLTYRRPACLGRVLPALLAQTTALGPSAQVLVVDNDPAGSARSQVLAYATSGVRYVHEPVPGIAAARNRALDESTEADALVFLDDDDLPGPGWLGRLVEAWTGWGCEAVTGPVRVRLPPGTDPWVAASGTLARAVRPSGQPVAGAATNNLLLDLAAVRDRGLRFDERLGLVGGEDALFTRQLTRSGGRILWCDEAEVWSELPADRATRGWVLRRRFRAGGSWSQMELSFATPGLERLRTRASLAARALARLGTGGATAAAGTLLRRQPWHARGLCEAAGSVGLLLGAFGYVYREYRRPPVPGSGVRGPEPGAAATG